MKRLLVWPFVVAIATATVAAQGAPQAAQGAGGQGGRGGGRGAQPPQTPRATAPLDLTGNWVAVISEDWRWRMVTPAKGDYLSIPLTQKAKDAADTWDPAKDTAAGEQCRSYGAPALMRTPTRLRISWRDDATLLVETDYGTQTRILQFAPGAPGERTWQGHSVATWDRAARGRGAGPAANTPAFGNGSLKVVTTNLRPGYLRKNGVPFSGDTVLTEYWDTFQAPGSVWWLVITSVVHDPANLQSDWITSQHFKKEADGSKWAPSPCSAEW
jgi:hypothetical protein